MPRRSTLAGQVEETKYVRKKERRGLPAKMHYRVIWPRVFELLETEKTDPPVGRPSTNKKAEIDQVVGEAVSHQSAEDGPTSKSTPEITSIEGHSNLRMASTIEKYDDDRLALMPYAADFARELNDQALLSSTTTRIVNLYKQSGLDLDTFIDRMMQAKAITQEKTATIRTQSDGMRGKPKIQYWFGVLEDLVS